MENLLIYFRVTPKPDYLLVKIAIKPHNQPTIFRTYRVEATTYEAVRSLVARACRELPSARAQLALPLPIHAQEPPCTQDESI